MEIATTAAVSGIAERLGIISSLVPSREGLHCSFPSGILDLVFCLDQNVGDLFDSFVMNCFRLTGMQCLGGEGVRGRTHTLLLVLP